jgi:hypothetical protein
MSTQGPVGEFLLDCAEDDDDGTRAELVQR